MTGRGFDALPLRRILASVDAHLTGALSETGLTIEQWRLLTLLVTGGPRPMAQLAALLALPGATLTRTADRLCASALAYRAVEPADRRKVLLHAAQRGIRLHDQLADRVRQAEIAGLQAADPDDVRAAQEMLASLTAEIGP